MTASDASDDLRDLYQDLILDHGKKPRNFRVLENANHEALGHNPLCGDRLMLYVYLDTAGLIKEATFQGSGCAISMASASMMTDMVKGKSLCDAEALFSAMHAACTGDVSLLANIEEDDAERIKALSGVRHYPMRVKCATLPWHTLHAALTNPADKTISTEKNDPEI